MNPNPRSIAGSSTNRRLTGLLGLALIPILAGPTACNVVPGLFEGGPPGGDEPGSTGGPVDLPTDENSPPIAVVGDELTAVVGELVVFDAAASFDPDGQIVEYRWDFGDGNAAEGAIVEHVFAVAGSSEVTLTVTDDQGAASCAIQTIIVEDTFELAVILEGEETGEVVLDPPGGVYAAGEIVSVTAIPADGYLFLRFEGDVLGNDTTVDALMDDDKRITAVFVPERVTVTVEIEPGGSGEVVLDPPGGVYDFGTIVTVEASAFGGFEFDLIADTSGTTLSTSAIFELEMNRDFELVAHFRERDLPPPPPPSRTLSVSVAPAGAGTVVIDPPGGNYGDGTVVTLEASPAPGYTFLRYSGDAVGTDPVIAVTMSSDKSVTAEFEWTPALGNPGNLLVTGFLGKNVTEFDRFDGSSLGEIVKSGAGGLSLAGGIDVGPGGDLFVVNVGLLNDTSVIRYDGESGTPVETFVTGSGAVGFLTLRFGPGGNLYVANTDSNSIEEYDGTTGTFISTFVTPGSGGLDNPVGLAFGPNGDLFVVSKDTDSIIRYSGATGEPLGTVVDLASFGFSVPVDLVFGADNALYVTLSGDESVARVDVATGIGETFVSAGRGGLDAPAGLVFHPDTNNLLVVSQGTNAVLEYDGDAGAFLDVFAEGAEGDSLFLLALRPQ